MDPITAAAAALVKKFKETTAVHDEVAALEAALEGKTPAAAAARKPARNRKAAE